MYKAEILNFIDENIKVHEDLKELTEDIQEFILRIIHCLRNGNKLLICGNGGSAADAQHFAAELVGRYKLDRKGLPAIALTTDTSALTAIANDFGYDQVFSKQVEALGNKGDLFIGISTSGNSPNIIKAVDTAKEMGLTTMLLLGKGGGKLKPSADHHIIAPSDNTPRIQEIHEFIIHTSCEIAEQELQRESP